MEFLYFLEGIRVPVLDKVMLLITMLGEETAFLAIGILIFWCVDKHHGYYFMGVGLCGNLLNQFLKITCRIPRPWVKDPGFHALEEAIPAAGGYSFPSGHSQTAVGTFGAIFATQKNKILRSVCVAFMVLVPFSRMYVGVHTPADVLVGSAMALLLVAVFYPLMLGNRRNTPWVFGTLLALGAAYLVYVEQYPFPENVDVHNLESAIKNGYTFLGCFAGFLVVYFVDEKKLHFSTKAIWWAQLIKAVLGLALVLAVKEGLRPVLEAVLPAMPARAVRYFIVVLVAGIVWPMTFRWFAGLGRKGSR